MIEALVGLQAQTPQSPYLALWSRLEPFDPEAMSALLRDRRTVRMTLMRTTIHLVTADDAVRLRPVLQDVMERGFRSGSPFGRKLSGVVDVGEVVEAGRAALDERAADRCRAEDDPRSSAGPTPTATRSPTRRATCCRSSMSRRAGSGAQSGLAAPADARRLARHRPSPRDATPDETVLRYLAAFGPATVADARTWSWMTGLREVFERLRPRLRTFRDEAGRELFDVPDAPLPDPDTPAPPRFLPDYDNLYLSHADRSRVIGAVGCPVGALGVRLAERGRDGPRDLAAPAVEGRGAIAAPDPHVHAPVSGRGGGRPREAAAMVAFLDPAVPDVPTEITIEPHPDLRK